MFASNRIDSLDSVVKTTALFEGDPMTNLRDKISEAFLKPSPSERKVIRVLLDRYPHSGLGSMTRVAEQAGVSDPTIIRLVKKLGFAGYPDFQEVLPSEMDQRLRSPRTLLQPRAPHSQDDAWTLYLQDSERTPHEALDLTQPKDVRVFINWILDSRHQISCFGSRLRSFLAGYLVSHLRLLRAWCHTLEDNAQFPDRMCAIQRQDLVLLFDYRRYQT